MECIYTLNRRQRRSGRALVMNAAASRSSAAPPGGRSRCLHIRGAGPHGPAVSVEDGPVHATRAKDAGVDATLEVWDRMVHVWHWFLPMLDEAPAAIARITEFLKKRIG